jgi:putative CocE/NonD family hydrolase
VQNFLGLRDGAGSDEARRGQKLVIGPWLHMPWAPVSADAAGVEPTVVDDLQLRWFDQFLKGEESRVTDAPVSLFIMGAEEWRDYPDWPPPGSEPVTWYLHSAGRANSRFGDGTLSPDAPEEEPPDIYTYDPAYPNQSAGGHSCCFSFISPMGPVDQRVVQELNSILVYTSEPLAAPMELIGDVSVTLFAATSAVDTDWATRLCEVWPDGRAINLQEGIVRARYRDSLTDPSLLEPDRVYEYEIPLGPVGARIAAGNRLRLTIASSDFPQWDRNLNTGGPLFSEVLTDAVVARQTVLHDALHPSHVTLPVVTKESR